MATTGRTTESTAPDAAAALSDATFVRVTAAPTGGSLAAAAQFALACRERDVPFQVRASTEAGAVDGDAAHVTFGIEDEDADVVVANDASNEAFETAQALGVEPDAVLAFAGAVADGGEPSTAVRERAALERRPGVGLPVADLAVGLAHATTVHAGFSGDESRAGALLAELGLPAELDDAARRRLASAVALDATEEATERGTRAIAAALRPHATPDGPFETVEGYADVLRALAWEAPGLGVALALGTVDRTDAVDAWKTHAQAAHRAIRTADPARHRGVVVADADAAQPTVARLLRDYRSVEPATLVAGDGRAALATTDANARDALGGVGTETLAVTEYDDRDALESGVREAL